MAVELTERGGRMVESAPSYYQFSEAYKQIQQAIASELDLSEEHELDLQKQLSVMTATWGLRYREERFNIPIIETDSYVIRRTRILSKIRGVGNFSAELIKTVCESFNNGTVEVSVDPSNYLVIIRFVDALGVPENISDLHNAIENIIHAHLGTEYQYKYLTINQVQAMTNVQMDSTKLSMFAPFKENF